MLAAKRLESLASRWLLAGALLVLACESDSSSSEPASATAPAAPERDAAPAPEPLPDAAAVLEAHVEAIGGRDAIQAIESLYIKSELRLDARKITGVSEMWWRRAGADAFAHFGMAQQLEGVGSNAAGFDGKELWVRDDFNGLRTLEGREAELYQRGSSPFLIAQWQKHFESAKTLARVQGPEGPMLEVELLSPLQQRVVMVFAESDGLLSELRYDELTPQGPRPLVSKPGDYRRVKGVRLAHEQRTQSAHGELVQKTVEVQANLEVDVKRFQSPLGGERVDVDPTQQSPAAVKTKK